jgi:hypothetical protein
MKMEVEKSVRQCCTTFIAMALFICSPLTIASGNSATITGRDHAEILDLVSRYSFAWDNRDVDAFAALWTDDAEAAWFTNGAEKPVISVRGIDEIRPLVAMRSMKLAEKGLITKHTMPNSAVTAVSDKEAKVTTHAIIFWQLKGVDLLPRPVQMGYYYSVVVKDKGEWKFKNRQVFLNGMFNPEEVYDSAFQELGNHDPLGKEFPR